ncbi:MAG: sugar kinase [Actinomycetales bacterium]
MPAAALSAVCVGETMAVLTPPPGVGLRAASGLLLGIGGAESNVAMGLAAMGLESHWIGRLGNDGFGARILEELRAHSVGTSGVEVDRLRPTGLYVKVPALVYAAGPDGGDAASVLYYRQGSAASAMGPETLDNPEVAALLRGASLIHLSGITAALSDGCAELTRRILSAPREGRVVSFDINWRPALWRDRDPSVLAALANAADVVLVGRDEAELAFGTGDEAELRTLLPDPAVLVVKDADVRATAWLRDGSVIRVPALAVEVLEPVGAGDAFAAGYLSGLIFGLDQRACLRRGHISAAATLTVHGDRGPLPPAAALAALLACGDEDWATIRMAAGALTAGGTVRL